MATDRVDYVHEKDATSIESAQVHSGNTDHNLAHERSVEDIDVYNTRAVKGDDSDGKVDWSLRSKFAAFFLAGLYTGSQIILYFIGGSISFIEEDLKLTHGTSWLSTANVLATAVVSPYAGYLQDLFGKRYIALFGSLCLCIGCALTGSAHTFGQILTGMALTGVGAAIGELTALAGLAEVVPVKHRGYSLGLMTTFLIPFMPYVMYVEMWSHHDSKVGWRWGPWCALIFNGIMGIGLLATYFPARQSRTAGFSRKAILKRIDYVGGILSTMGLTLFLVALQSGGYTHGWSSAYVLCTLLIGLGLIVAWVVWEWKFAPHPMVPGALFKGQRIVGLVYVVAFAAGMNFFSVLNLFPVTYSAVYAPGPVQVGLKGLAPAFATAFGAIFFNGALSQWPGRSREVLLVAVLFMTAFTGSIACSTPENPKLTIALGSLACFGIGGVLVPAATVAMIVCPDALITTAAALSISIRTVGGSIGYSIYYNIFATKLTQKLPTYVAEYALAAGLPLSSVKTFVSTFLTIPEEVVKIPGVTLEIVDAATVGTRWAYSQSLKYVWFTSIAFGSVAIICTVLLPNTRKYATNRVAVQI